MQVKTTRLSTFDGLELKEASFRKLSFPDHFHDTYSIGIIEKGIERLYYGSKEVIAHANAVTIINPYDIHSNSYFDNDSWTYRALYISRDIMRYMQQRTGLFAGGDIWFPQELVDDAYLYNLILHFHASNDCTPTDLNTLLAYLIRRYAMQRPELQQVYSAITDASYFIQEHFTDKCSIPELAAKYGMDKYKFIRLFKKQTGLTPISYLLLHRIDKSKKLLSLNMNITEVALETGFYDQSHFVHCFKKYTGVAPLTYKKSMLSLPE